MARKNKSSQRRIEANQRNAQKSTGQGTPGGKTSTEAAQARSAQNATTHGLSNPLTRAHFLHCEDERQFQTLLGEYLQTYKPQHRDEYDLLQEAVYAKWRQDRFWLAETAQLEMTMARNQSTFQKELPRADAAAHLANAVAESADLLKLYLRYGQQLHRQYLRCLKELRDLQSQRPDAPTNTDRRGGQTNPDREGGDPKTAATLAQPNQATPRSAPSTGIEPTEPNQPSARIPALNQPNSVAKASSTTPHTPTLITAPPPSRERR
jgi:hypothetical protein